MFFFFFTTIGTILIIHFDFKTSSDRICFKLDCSTQLSIPSSEKPIIDFDHSTHYTPVSFY